MAPVYNPSPATSADTVEPMVPVEIFRKRRRLIFMDRDSLQERLSRFIAFAAQNDGNGINIFVSISNDDIFSIEVVGRNWEAN